MGKNSTFQHGITIEEMAQFWRKVNKPKTQNDCVTYYASRITFSQSVNRPEISLTPQRLSWIYHHGSLDEEYEVYSKCKSRRCVNPNHLATYKTKPPKPAPPPKEHPVKKKQSDHIDEVSYIQTAHGKIPGFYLTDKWLDLRSATLKRDKFICQYCGGKAWQADHIIPRRRGGADALHNLKAVCQPCNKLAGGRKFESFEAKKMWILNQIK